VKPRPKSKTALLRERMAVLIDALRELGYEVETSPASVKPRAGFAWFAVRTPTPFVRHSLRFIHYMAAIQVGLDGRIKLTPVEGTHSPNRVTTIGGKPWPALKTSEEEWRDAEKVRTALKKVGLSEWLVP
jgi:hypothetical protein